MVEIFDFNTKGACYGYEYNPYYPYYPWFGPVGEKKGAEKDTREAIARMICAECEVVDLCLQYALERETPSRVDGFFGGKTEEERKEILRTKAKQEAV